ncbi:MAG: NADPH:quinone oxidoreductase family protein [Hyphomicrobiaceae bacterium]
MKAALCKSLGGPDAIVIEDIAEPVAGSGEVLVRVKAASLNFLDTLQTRGKYQVKPPLPFSPAGEFAGVVEVLGAGVTGLKVGDRVFGYGAGGAAREKVAAAAVNLVPIPDGVSDEVASGVTVTYGTGMHGLKDRAQLKVGETCAVLGASGGAGLAAVELAKLMGATVIACASTDEKLAVCKSRGADALINYSQGDLKEKLREATGGKGVDVIYDCVGDKYAEPAIRAMNWGGRYLVIGFAAGEIPRIPLNLLLLKSCSLVGVFWGAHVARNPGAHRANMLELMSWVASGKLKPHVHKVFPLEQTGDAIRELDRRASTGKVVIKV